MFALVLHVVAPLASVESALGQWIQAEGGFISNRVAVKAPGGRRGLYVTEAVSAGAELARVPKSCLIFAEEFDLQPEWGLSLGEFLTAGLGGAKQRGEKSPYIDALPASEELLADWKPAELAMLQSPRLEREARSQADHRRGMVSNVAKWVPNADASMLGWAETMVRSRALTFESGWQGSEMMCMVPFVDLANHRVPLADEVPCFPVDLVTAYGQECVVRRRMHSNQIRKGPPTQLACPEAESASRSCVRHSPWCMLVRRCSVRHAICRRTRRCSSPTATMVTTTSSSTMASQRRRGAASSAQR